MNLSTNLDRGRQIKNPLQILKLAEAGKAIALFHGDNFVSITPAAFVQNWNLKTLVKYSFYRIKKTKTVNETNHHQQQQPGELLPAAE